MTAALTRQPADLSALVEAAATWTATAGAEEVLSWAVESFAHRLAVSCSFGNPEGLVLIDMLQRVAPGRFRVYTLDTGLPA